MRTSIRIGRVRRIAAALVVAASCSLAISQVGLWLAIEPIATWSYDLSWWSAIVLLDAVVFLRRGASMLLSRPRAFLGLAFASAVYWLLYECANLRLSNWYYVGIPPDPWTRSVGVFVSFATVLPGVLEIHSALALLPRAEPTEGRPRAPSRRARAALTAAGIACLALPLLFPRVAYPLVWGAAFLTLEPRLAEIDERSLLGRWIAGDRRPLFDLLAAGAISGALWETWNFRSPAKWIYTVPFFEEGKLFEMPYLGFVGFVPFALGCHSFARALVAARCLPEWDPAVRDAPPPDRRRVLAATAVGLAFSVFAIAAMNRATVRSTRAAVGDLPGVSSEDARRLERDGVRFPEDLVAASERGADTGLAAGVIEAARLAALRQMGTRGLSWLASVGVRSVAELAAREPEALYVALVTAGPGPSPEPTPAEVRVWVRGARTARP